MFRSIDLRLCDQFKPKNSILRTLFQSRSRVTFELFWEEGEILQHLTNDNGWYSLSLRLIDEYLEDQAHFWLNGYVNKQNCRIWSEANPQVYVETPLHPEKLTVWCALWAGGILLQKR
ncbi:hypothetical protein TNCV_2078671 [Trichonephila clavipes]|nr:hypothetical protein TNCV_2078671 [Trichonephila clavipes]